jgi:hypothetical protein
VKFVLQCCKERKPKNIMATYRISGVWKDGETITHYAFHTVTPTGATRASKKSKAQAVALVEAEGNTTTTYMWSYVKAQWNIGEKVDVVNGANGKFLRSHPDGKVSDNLGHLIDYDWIAL